VRESVEEFDIVVVGGGSGGSAVAGRLSEGGRYSVCLIEAGGRNTGYRTIIPGFVAYQTPKTNWAFETVPQPGLNGRRGYQPRGRGLGGSSAINGMVYIRGNRWDYDNWAAMGCKGGRMTMCCRGSNSPSATYGAQTVFMAIAGHSGSTNRFRPIPVRSISSKREPRFRSHATAISTASGRRASAFSR